MTLFSVETAFHVQSGMEKCILLIAILNVRHSGPPEFFRIARRIYFWHIKTVRFVASGKIPRINPDALNPSSDAPSKYKYNNGTASPTKICCDSIWYLTQPQCKRLDSQMKFPARQQLHYQNLNLIFRRTARKKKTEKKPQKNVNKEFRLNIFRKMEKCALAFLSKWKIKERKAIFIKINCCIVEAGGGRVVRMNALRLGTKAVGVSADARSAYIYMRSCSMKRLAGFIHFYVIVWTLHFVSSPAPNTQCAHFVVW